MTLWCEVLHARMWCSLIYTLQTIFVATSCSYIYFLSGIDKATFLRYFYQHAEFISSGKYNLPGTLADVDRNKINSGFLAFLRLVGTIYSKQHSSGFSTTPDRHFNKFTDPNPLQQHCSWLDDIRQTIWIKFESEMSMSMSYQWPFSQKAALPWPHDDS